MARRPLGLGFYLIVIVITAGALFTFKNYSGGNDWPITPANSTDIEQIIFDVESGQSARTIGKNLKSKGLITSKSGFLKTIKKQDLASQLQAGRYVLSPAMTPNEIIASLTGGAGQVAITIPEGFTLEQIDNRLAAAGLSPDNQFRDCAKTCPLADRWDFLKTASSVEGYLFPDTFFADPASHTSEGFLHRLLGNFEAKFLTDENQAALTTAASSGRTLDDIVIMASIVEREAFLDEDYPVIAGILWKRLDNGWPLDADATLLYVLDDPSDLAANLDLDSPYNSRKNRGLPPTAISNPGLTALQAALYPEDSSYWFYLNDQDTGKAHFATTNDEHNANKAKWLR